LTVQYADSDLGQPSGRNTLGYLKYFKQKDRIKSVETGETRLGFLKYGIWLGLRP